MLDHHKVYSLGKSWEIPVKLLTGTTQDLGNVHKKSPRLQVMPGNHKGAFNTITTFKVNLYYIYGWSAYYI